MAIGPRMLPVVILTMADNEDILRRDSKRPLLQGVVDGALRLD